VVSVKAQKRLPLLFLVLAVACLGVAFAQFRLSSEAREATVVLAVDVSKSMGNTDVLPDRLSAAKDAAVAFLAEVPAGYRVGLVTFRSVAEVRVQPTSEHPIVTDAVESLTVATDGGTVIGDGLHAAVEAVRTDTGANDTGAAAILLLSDGQDTGSATPPQIAAEEAGESGILVFTVVLGQPSTDPEVPGADLDAMQALADRTGGSAFTAETTDELRGIYERLGATLSTELAVTDIGVPFIVTAGVLVLLAAYFFVKTASRF